MTERVRRVLLIVHPKREVALAATRTACRLLLAAKIIPVFAADEIPPLVEAGFDISHVETLGIDCQGASLELVMVLGGDGTILRAAEVVRHDATPILGVNLGHVGFLAESERADLEGTVARIVDGAYTVDERLAIDVAVEDHGRIIHRDWALNDATIEKSRSDKMIGVTCAIAGTPLTGFSCDGMILATPTGSTAYCFSAGGPIVWPNVEAMLMVPLSAHALFARPLVVAPTSTMSVLLSDESTEGAELCCDGRRTVHIPAGALVSATRSTLPVRLARLHTGTFVDRLVHKFDLPTSGWRQRAQNEPHA